MSAGSLVQNDIAFDENARIYILTGANSGGKSIFTMAVGIAQCLFQCGIPVPARKATMTICDLIQPYLPISDSKSNPVSMMKDSSGRLEIEIKTVMNIIESSTVNSLVLMDEVFTSTSEAGAVELAKSVLKKLGQVGCKCIFTTHLHRLAADTD